MGWQITIGGASQLMHGLRRNHSSDDHGRCAAAWPQLGSL